MIKSFNFAIKSYIVIILLFLSCKNSGKSLSVENLKDSTSIKAQQFEGGLYTAHRPTQREKWIFRTLYKSEFRTSLIISIDFKKDSTYVMGACTRKVMQRGNWRLNGDTILLTNIITRTNKIHMPDKFLRFNRGYVFYTLLYTDEDTLRKGWKTYTTILKKGGELFDGKLDEE